MGMLYGRKFDNLMIPRDVTPTLPVIVNGQDPAGSTGYLNAPARDEDPQHRMDNLLVPSRYSVWSTRVGNSALSSKIHIDLTGGLTGVNLGGLNKTVNFVGIHGLRGLGGAAPTSTIAVGSRTRTQGYLATGYTSIGSISTSAFRDSGLSFTTPQFRYLELSFSYSVAGMAIGSIFVGNLLDLGTYWSSDGGSQYESEGNLLWSRTAGGHATAVQRGDPWARWSLRFNSVTTATRQYIMGDFGSWGGTNRYGDPVTIIDENGLVRQCVVVGGPSASQRFDKLYDVSMDLEQLG
jgi:hypothetical protein